MNNLRPVFSVPVALLAVAAVVRISGRPDLADAAFSSALTSLLLGVAARSRVRWWYSVWRGVLFAGVVVSFLSALLSSALTVIFLTLGGLPWYATFIVAGVTVASWLAYSGTCRLRARFPQRP